MRLKAWESSSNSSPVRMSLRKSRVPRAISSATSLRCSTGLTITYRTIAHAASIASTAVTTPVVSRNTSFRARLARVAVSGSVTCTAPSSAPRSAPAWAWQAAHAAPL